MDKMKIAERLVKLRGSKSQADVARDLRMSKSALSRYESGERVPSDARKVSFAEYYGMTVQELFYT